MLSTYLFYYLMASLRAAEQMTIEGGEFEFSTLFLDHQNDRIINFNSFNAFLYDHMLQSITSIFTAHSKLEDKFSVCIIFKLFDQLYKESLKTEESFNPHGFCSDNAGAIGSGLEMHFGPSIRHRTCTFHYLYGAYQHCCNAIGKHSSQIRYLRFAYELLEAATPKKFELIYRNFVIWIDKNKSRKAKLKPWLKWWYARKVQWATAYTALSIDGGNLAEGGQSKYRKNNKMKRLQLYQGCIYECGDMLLYSNRLKAMSSQNFVGKGPSKDILDERKARQKMDKVKEIFMTEDDMQDCLEYLGIKKKGRKSVEKSSGEEDLDLSSFTSSTPIKSRPFIENNVEDLDDALEEFRPNPNSPYTYKSPRVKDPFKGRKSGRPTGTKKKRPSRHEEPMSDSSVEERTSIKRKGVYIGTSESDIDSNDSEKNPKRLKSNKSRYTKKRKNVCFVEESSDGEPNSKRKRNDEDYCPDVSSSESMDLPDIDKYSTNKRDTADKNESVVATDIIEKNKISPEFLRKRTRTKDSKQFTEMKKKAKTEAVNYVINLKTQLPTSFTFELQHRITNAKHTVTFDEKNVICSCRAFKKIEESAWNSAQDVCKHVALIVLFCHDNLKDNYKGQRFFSTRNSFSKISEMLKSFNPKRNLNQIQKHSNYFLYPAPIPNPDKKFSYFSKKEYAINLLRKLKQPVWIAEKYNRESSRGDLPRCKACNAKISIGTICLRLDHTYVFRNRNYKQEDWTLKSAPYRLCKKQECIAKFENKTLHSKAKEDTNLHAIQSIDIVNIFDNDQNTVRRLLKDKKVTFL